MEVVFLKILNMSISATFLVAAVLLLRLLFKKRVPKWISVLLWGIVAVRLVVPFSVESRFSLMPKAEFLPVENILEAPEKMSDGESKEELGDAAQENSGSLIQDGVPYNSTVHKADSTEKEDTDSSTEKSDVQLNRPNIFPNMGSEKKEDVWNDMEWKDIAWNDTAQKDGIPEDVIQNLPPDSELGRQEIEATAGQKNYTENTVPQDAPAENQQNILPEIVFAASYVWLAGIAVLLLYTAFSYVRLKKSVVTAVPMTEVIENISGSTEQRVYQCETVKSPFVLGIFSPKIYLPFVLEKNDISMIVEHEKAHIERRDHWWKPLGFLLLTLHWFNPVLWAAYVLFCRDIELACDEKVVRLLEAEQRAAYSQALLNCNANRRSIAACPLAFGEVGVKERVKSVLHYKKPAFWMIIAAVVVCVVLGVCFLTDPVDASETSKEEPSGSTIVIEGITPSLEQYREAYQELKEGMEDGTVLTKQPSTMPTPSVIPTQMPEETTAPSSAPQPMEDAVKIAPGAYGTLGDIAYYMELSVLGKSFENMDTEVSEVFLAEYGSLLEEYRFVCRQSTDGTRSYILGIYEGEEGADKLTGSTIEVTKSELFFTTQEGTILILPNEMEERMNSAVNNYFLESRGREYIADAVSRGVSLDIPEEGPYLTVYLISEEYGELSEMLPVTEEEAVLMLTQERGKLQQGYGFAAVLHCDGEDTYFLDSNGIPDKALELAVERCGYRFDSPESITDWIQSATLECNWLANPVCDADESRIIRLTEILKGAEFEGIGKCGYGAKLTLELVNGKVITAYKGTDGCGSIAFGSYGGYSLGAEEDAEFWEIFGLDAENHTPKRAYQLDYEEAPHAMLSAEEWMKKGYLKLPFTWDTAKYAELTMAEKRTMFYIPEEALKEARTADLYNVALEWQFTDYGFNFPSYYLNFIMNGFNGMDELFQREDFGATLLWKYKSLNFRPLCTYPDGPAKTDYEIDAWWDENDIVLTEILLATDVVFEQLTDREREMVLEAMEAKMQLRATRKYICADNVNGFYAYIREYAKTGSKWYAYLMKYHADDETQMKYLYTTGYPTGSVVFPKDILPGEDENIKQKLVSLVGDEECQNVVYYQNGEVLSAVVSKTAMNVLSYNKVQSAGCFYIVIYNMETEETLLLEKRVAEQGFQVLFLPQQGTTYLPVVSRNDYCGVEYYDMSVYRVADGRVAMGTLPQEDLSSVLWWQNYKPELNMNGTVGLRVRNGNPDTGDFTSELIKDTTLYSYSDMKTDYRAAYVSRYAYNWKTDGYVQIPDLTYVENQRILTSSMIFSDVIEKCLKPIGCAPSGNDRDRFYGLILSTIEDSYQLVVCKQLGNSHAAGRQNVAVLVYDAKGELVATDCCSADEASVTYEEDDIHVFARYNQQGYVETLIDGVVSFEDGKIVYR